MAAALALVALAFAFARDGATEVAAPLAVLAVVAAVSAASAAGRPVVLSRSALLLPADGVSIPFTDMGALARGLVVVRPSRGTPGPLVLDAAAATLGRDRLDVRAVLWVFDRDGRTLLRLDETRVSRLEDLARALAGRTGLRLADGLGVRVPYPVEERAAERVDHLSALLDDLHAGDPPVAAAARDLLHRGGRADLAGAGEAAPAVPPSA